MLVSLFLTVFRNGNLLKAITIPQVVSWLPGMFFNVGSLCAGSITLSQLPLPAFLAIHAASDAVLLLLDSHLPSGMLQMSLTIKLITIMMVVWYSAVNLLSQSFNWICAFTILHGLQKCALFWYRQPNWPQSNLTRVERQFLNDVFAVVVLGMLAFFFGHHITVYNEFPHLSRSVFYIGCLMSGILGWLARQQVNILHQSDSKLRTGMTQLLAKVIAMLISMQFHNYPDPMLLWLCNIAMVGGDLLFVLGSALEDASDVNLRKVSVDS